MLQPGNSSGSSSSRSGRRVYKSVRDGRSLDPPEPRCACKVEARKMMSRTPRNPDREYLSCGSTPGRCSIWIWRDILMEYVEEMLDYCGAPLKEMLDDANRKLADQARLINSLRLKIEQDSSDREQEVGEVRGCITKLEGSVRRLKMFIWGTILLVSSWLAIEGSASSLVTILLAVTSMYVVVG
ncbi:hypothetical protein VPH35_043374 [Triticum aestivum]|uniref:uncharacterized protein n=1 Tax=Triticum aestivum TaxID=4565 RepID=UPI00162E38C1|nr:uncharacterized protein LOC123058036 [Triticum aestivum]